MAQQGPAWICRQLGRAIVAAQIATQQRRQPTDEELDAVDEQTLIALGWEWRNANLAQLRLVGRKATEAETYLRQSPGHAIDHIKVEGTRALGALAAHPAGAELVRIIKTGATGNREQVMILLNALQSLGYQE